VTHSAQHSRDWKPHEARALQAMANMAETKSTALTKKDADDLKRIEDIIKNARATWFGLLGALVFAGITLLGVDDLDFFGVDRNTKLPLVNVSVPVLSFFGAGSALVTALYVYLHLYLEHLWKALGEVEPRIDGRPVAERIFPWLVADWALRRRNKLRPGEPDCHTKRAMAAIGTLTSISLVWLFGLLIIGYFWWRSMPAHYWFLTTAIGLLFVFALWTAWTSWRTARRMLGVGNKPATKQWVAFAALGTMIVFLSLVRTEWDLFPSETFRYSGWTYSPPQSEEDKITDNFFNRFEIDPAQMAKELVRPVRAELVEKHLTKLPDNWFDRETAEKDFRQKWALRHNIPYADPFLLEVKQFKDRKSVV